MGTRKSLGICTLPSERSKHISIASFCVSESRVASSGLSSRLCSIGGNYGWRESNPSRAQRRRTPHHPMRSRGLQEPGDRRFARDHRARGENLFALGSRTSWDCGTESRALWYGARQPRAGLSHLSFVGDLHQPCSSGGRILETLARVGVRATRRNCRGRADLLAPFVRRNFRYGIRRDRRSRLAASLIREHRPSLAVADLLCRELARSRLPQQQRGCE